MDTLKIFIRNHPLVTYFALTFAISWGGVLLVIGGPAAFILSRFMSTLLFEISPRDPITFAAVSALLVAVALLSCYIPARRATRVDPMIALRYE